MSLNVQWELYENVQFFNYTGPSLILLSQGFVLELILPCVLW